MRSPKTTMRLRRNAVIKDSSDSVPSVALGFMRSVASVIMEDYRHRVNEVVADRMHLLPLRPALFLLRAPAGAHQDRPGADGVPEIDVEPLVADHPRPCGIDAEIARRVLDHSGQRLAASAVD